MEELLDVLSSAIGSLTNPNKLQNTFKSVNNSKLTSTTITKYIEYLEDAFLIEETQRYDIKGRKYIGTPLKYYFTDLGLRNSRISFRQLEVTHSMENAIYNELRMRGFNVDIGNIILYGKDKDGKSTKKQLEIDFVCNKGFDRFYIQSAYSLIDEDKLKKEEQSFDNIKDNFDKVIITFDDSISYHRNEKGYIIMNLFEFLLNKDSI